MVLLIRFKILLRALSEVGVCIPQPREWGPRGLPPSPNPGEQYGVPILMDLTNIGQFLRLIRLFWLKVHLHFKGENAVERLKNKAMFVFCGKGIAAP